MNLFGKRKPAAPTVAQSIHDIQAQIDRLEKREEHLQTFIQDLNQEAKTKLQRKDKKGAISTLRRRKLKEKDLDKIEGMKYNLYMQISAMEEAAQNKQQLKVMMRARAALKEQLSDHDVDHAAEVMDDIEEQRAMVEEWGRALAQPIGGEMLDEDELDQELAELQAELDEEITYPQQQIQDDADLDLGAFPDAPEERRQKQQQQQPLSAEEQQRVDEDDELAALME